MQHGDIQADILGRVVAYTKSRIGYSIGTSSMVIKKYNRVGPFKIPLCPSFLVLLHTVVVVH
jgi:hypothetical protein